LEPAAIAPTFDDVIVQYWPGSPRYCEHSLVTCRARARDVDATVRAWLPTAIASGTRHERFLADLGASLGEAALEAARERGRGLPLEQLVA